MRWQLKKIHVLSLVGVALVLSCNSLNNLPSAFATPTAYTLPSAADCPNPQPTQNEVDRARAYQESTFTDADWKTSYTVTEFRVSVTRQHDPLGAVINFDYVIFCGATFAALREYYSDAAFDIIFQNYDAHEFTGNCRAGNILLYELHFTNLGYEYNGRYWVEILDGNHIRETLMVFPETDAANLDEYSSKIMPTLRSCK
mgnify:CR=1 FL=1